MNDMPDTRSSTRESIAFYAIFGTTLALLVLSMFVEKEYVPTIQFLGACSMIATMVIGSLLCTKTEAKPAELQMDDLRAVYREAKQAFGEKEYEETKKTGEFLKALHAFIITSDTTGKDVFTMDEMTAVKRTEEESLIPCYNRVRAGYVNERENFMDDLRQVAIKRGAAMQWNVLQQFAEELPDLLYWKL